MLSMRSHIITIVFFLLVAVSSIENENITETIGVPSSTVLQSTATVTAPTDLMTEEATSPSDIASHVICNECSCSGQVVNCSNRDLKRAFAFEDWVGLQYDLGINVENANVDLSGNFFISLSQFPNLEIGKLNLSNCDLEILEGGTFSNLNKLAVLDLSRNKLSFVISKRVFMGVSEGKKRLPFKYLQHLSLAHNELHSLSQDVFTYLTFLTYLDLSGNPLASIDQVTMGALSDLKRLEELRISECELESLPVGIFRRLKRLKRLDLSGNKFTVLPNELVEATNLQYLNFNGNPIQVINERSVISNLTSLVELHISRSSSLKSIAAGALGGLEKLVKLQISYNPRLTTIDPRFLEWEDDMGIERRPLLQELRLNNNNLSKIDSRLLDHWSSLAHVDFTANPYICDCSNQWMVDVLVPLVETLTNTSTAKMICRNPYDYRGLTFAQLYETRNKLPCLVGDAVTEGASVETAVLYGILVGILISFPIVLFVVVLWKRGFFARCRKKMNSHGEYFDDEETDAF